MTRFLGICIGIALAFYSSRCDERPVPVPPAPTDPAAPPPQGVVQIDLGATHLLPH
jgi:hypothetical protein